MKSTNMDLWNSVEKTDPGATKKANVNGQSITSINGLHVFRKATETFGPWGTGWGAEVITERYDQGGPVTDKEGAVIARETSHTVHIRLWYVLDGKRGEVQAYGCTPFVYRSKWGATTDMEAPKKSFTDAVKKALSGLGFSADVYMGMFDDLDYYQERIAETEVEKAEDKEAEIERQKQERLDWLKDAVRLVETATSLGELKKLHATYVRSATRRKEESFVKRLAKAYEQRSKELQEKEQTA
jgi:uncharacterized protein YdcH (DUF465 family)